MKKVLLTIALLAATAGGALAGGRCDVPKKDWQPQEALQTKLEQEGWKIRQIKIQDGCYEVYAVNKAGKRMETFFNPQTFESAGNDED